MNTAGYKRIVKQKAGHKLILKQEASTQHIIANRSIINKTRATSRGCRAGRGKSAGEQPLPLPNFLLEMRDKKMLDLEHECQGHGAQHTQ